MLEAETNSNVIAQCHLHIAEVSAGCICTAKVVHN